MADNLAMTIVLALGAGVLGGPDALNIFLTIAGQSPFVDIAISIFLIAALAAPILGTILLALFFRKLDIAAGAGGGAPAAVAMDLLAKMTLTVSMAVASLITACFLVTLFVENGGAGELRLLLSFAGKNPIVAAAAAAAAAPALAVMPLYRFIRDREARSAAVAGGSESPVVPARALSSKIALLVPLAGAFLFLLAGYLLLIPFLAAEPGPDGVTLSCSA